MFGNADNIAYLGDSGSEMFSEQDMRQEVEKIVSKARDAGWAPKEALIWWHQSVTEGEQMFKEDWINELNRITENGIYKAADKAMQDTLIEYLSAQAERAEPKVRIAAAPQEEYQVNEPKSIMDVIGGKAQLSQEQRQKMKEHWERVNEGSVAPKLPAAMPDRVPAPEKLPILKQVAPKPVTQLALGAGGYFAGKMLFNSPIIGALVGIASVPLYVMLKGK